MDEIHGEVETIWFAPGGSLMSIRIKGIPSVHAKLRIDDPNAELTFDGERVNASDLFGLLSSNRVLVTLRPLGNSSSVYGAFASLKG